MAKHIFSLRRGWKETDADGNVTRDDWAEYETEEDHMKPLEGELVLEYDNGIPRLKIGDNTNEFSALPYMSIDSFILPKQEYVHLSTQWDVASDDRYFQEVAVDNAIITSKSKIDLQPSAEQLSIFHEKDLAFVAENEGGVVRVYCVGQVPQNSYDIPVTVTEVVTDETTIIGNTTATPNPQPDWAQADTTQADYIKNKPDLNLKVDKSQIDEPNGVAPLDENAKVPDANIPESIGRGGTWYKVPMDLSETYLTIPVNYWTSVYGRLPRVGDFVLSANGSICRVTASSETQVMLEYLFNISSAGGDLSEYLKTADLANELVNEFNTPTKTLTDDDQTKACDWLGAVKKPSAATSLVGRKQVTLAELQANLATYRANHNLIQIVSISSGSLLDDYIVHGGNCMLYVSYEGYVTSDHAVFNADTSFEYIDKYDLFIESNSAYVMHTYFEIPHTSSGGEVSIGDDSYDITDDNCLFYVWD